FPRWVGRRAATRWALARSGRELAGSGRLQPCEFLDFNGRQGQAFEGGIAHCAFDTVELLAVLIVVDPAVNRYSWLRLDAGAVMQAEVFARPLHYLAAAAQAEQTDPCVVPLEVNHAIGQGVFSGQAQQHVGDGPHAVLRAVCYQMALPAVWRTRRFCCFVEPLIHPVRARAPDRSGAWWGRLAAVVR